MASHVNNLQDAVVAIENVVQGSLVNVKSTTYGAKGNAIRRTDGAVAVGTPTAFSAPGATFTPADVGKKIYINGAGAAGIQLATSISAFVDATHVTLANAASTTVSGAVFYYGTDDTAAIQAAINAGGQTFFPSGAYLCATALNLNDKKNLILAGTAGSDSSTISGGSLLWMFGAAGSGARITQGSTAGIVWKNMKIHAATPEFDGALITTGWSAANADSGYLVWQDCLLSAHNQTPVSLVDLNKAIIVQFLRSHFINGTYGIMGVNANYSNVVSIRDCTFNTQLTSAIRNPGQSWHIDNCTFEPLSGGGNSAVSQATTYLAYAFKFDNCWVGDGNNTGIIVQVKALGAKVDNCYFATGLTGVTWSAGTQGAGIYNTRSDTLTNFVDHGAFVNGSVLIGNDLNGAAVLNQANIVSGTRTFLGNNAYPAGTTDVIDGKLNVVNNFTLTGLPTASQPTLSVTATFPYNASAEVSPFILDAKTLNLSGSYATNRFLLVSQPTVTGAFTLTTGATVAIAGAPNPSGSTITNAFALWVQAGSTRFDGGVMLTSGGTRPIGALLDLRATTGAIGGATVPGTSVVGDKIALFDATYGVGYQTNTLVLYAAAGQKVGFRARQASADASAGTEYFTFRTGDSGAVAAEAPALNVAPGTYTLSAGFTNQRWTLFTQPTLTGAFTVTNSATVVIQNAPAVTGGAAITNAYALWVTAGNVRLDGSTFDLRATAVSNGGQTSGVVGFPIAMSNVGTITAETPGFKVAAQTLTLTGSYTNQRFNYFDQPTVSGAFTITSAATVYIAGPVISSGGATVTNSYALWSAGATRVDGVFDLQGAVVKNNAQSGGVTGVSFFLANVGTVSTETIGWRTVGQTLTITGGYTNQRFTLIDQPTITAGSALTVTNAYTMYIAGPPLVAGSAVVTNNYALYAGGNVQITGTLDLAGQTQITNSAPSGQNLKFVAGTWGTAAGESFEFDFVPSTLTINGAYTTQRFTLFEQPTISAATSQTVTNSATVAIAGAPLAAGAGPAVITNKYAFWVQAGQAQFDGAVQAGSTLGVTGTATLSGALDLRGSVNKGGLASGGNNFNILGQSIGTITAETVGGLRSSAATQTITGGYSTQRFNLFEAWSISAGSALTVTTAATVAITGASTVGGSAAITNNYALWVQAGQTQLDGTLAYTKDRIVPQATIGFASTITPDASGQEWLGCTLTGPITVNAPTNLKSGHYVSFHWLQDGTGGRVITYNAAYHTTGITAISTAANTHTFDVFWTPNGTVLYWISRSTGIT